VGQFFSEEHLQLEPGYLDQFGLALFVLVQILGDFLAAVGGDGRRAAPERLLLGPARGRPRRPSTHIVTQTLLVDGGTLLQGEVNGGGAFLAQSPHRLQQPAPVHGVENADGVQIGVAHLLADLQVIVAVVDETLGVLAEVQGSQPFGHDVAGHDDDTGTPLATKTRSERRPPWWPAGELLHRACTGSTRNRTKNYIFAAATHLRRIPNSGKIQLITNCNSVTVWDG
jgi:hypothetical protein